MICNYCNMKLWRTAWVHICKECGYGIYEGDHYYDGPDGYYCEECLEDMSVKELVELLGDELKTA